MWHLLGLEKEKVVMANKARLEPSPCVASDKDSSMADSLVHAFLIDRMMAVSVVVPCTTPKPRGSST